MDPRLLAWAHAARRRSGKLPPLWLFTDTARMPDPMPIVARLPRGLAGIVFRHDDDPHRRQLGRALSRICRQRRLTLVVAGDVGLANELGAGVHLRGGRRAGGRVVRHRPVTSSAHGMAEIVRAHRAGADLIFLSPVFATASHPGAAGLGVSRWARLSAAAKGKVAALGGIDHITIRRLPRRFCNCVGAIGALA